MHALLIFPHQLFESNGAMLARIGRAFIVEDALFFLQYDFHKLKLVLHRASMRAHQQFLSRYGAVEYIDSAGASSMRVVLEGIRRTGADTLHYIDVADDWLERRLLREARACGIALSRHESPMWLTGIASLREHFQGSRPAMSKFYAARRIERQVLVDGHTPFGGKWSFDTDNRKRLARDAAVPALPVAASNAFVEEAQTYVQCHFPANPGEVAPFDYPVQYADAKRWLAAFVRDRLARFGDFQDAICVRHDHLYHSVLTPMMNIGLLTPQQVLDAALSRRDQIPINNLEGFIRQVLGWREYVRGAYLFKGRAQRTRNFWNHQRSVPASFRSATTNILPIDRVIARVRRSGYAHHIERLMLLANFMGLCEFHPDQVYRWFMEMFIDAYDWVMVPNVYGMGLYADGGLITTKPYLCGSNYILKMSDFAPGAWCDIWDGLYWRFVAKHRAVLAANPRLQMTVHSLERLPAGRRESLLGTAEQFLSQLG